MQCTHEYLLSLSLANTHTHTHTLFLSLSLSLCTTVAFLSSLHVIVKWTCVCVCVCWERARENISVHVYPTHTHTFTHTLTHTRSVLQAHSCFYARVCVDVCVCVKQREGVFRSIPKSHSVSFFSRIYSSLHMLIRYWYYLTHANVVLNNEDCQNRVWKKYCCANVFHLAQVFGSFKSFQLLQVWASPTTTTTTSVT